MVFHELPLVIFTVLAQCAVGAFLTITYRMACETKSENAAYPMQSIFFVLGFMAIGFFSSTMHLGSPLRALNSLNRVGHSGLSNEILSGSVFFAFAGIYWLTEVFKVRSEGARKGLRYLAAIAGIAFMYFMQEVYLINTVPLWNTVFTPVEFIATVVTTGVLFGYVLLNMTNASNSQLNQTLASIGVLLIALHIVLLAVRSFDFMSVTTAIHSGVAQLSQVSHMIVAQVCLLVLTGIIWAVSAHQDQSMVKTMALVALVIALAAELFGRGAFYGLHFTVGLL